MEGYEEFINGSQNIERIKEIAKTFGGFRQNIKALYEESIYSKIVGWLGNFKTLENIDYNLLLDIISRIQFITDNEIEDEFLDIFFEKSYRDEKFDPFIHIKDSDNRIYKKSPKKFFICPLGEKFESSFRLTSLLSNIPTINFRENINELLELMEKNYDENNVIVFMDDFLFSGGQLNSIFYKALGEEPDEINNEYEDRVEIKSAELKDLFRKTKIALYFGYVFFSGYENTIITLKNKLKLNIKPYFKNIENEKCGVFGTPAEIKNMLDGSTLSIVSGKPLKGNTHDNLKPYYELFFKIGVELLKIEKENWSENRYKECALGYGNNAKLIIGQQNVPTATLTALWLPVLSPDNTPIKNKPINIDGKEINWKPLFYRKPKKIGESQLKEIEIEEVSFPKITIKKVNNSSLEWTLDDTNFYDLISVAGLNRANYVLIYGHEKFEIINLELTLNQFEDNFNYFGFKFGNFRRRKWITFGMPEQIELENAVEKLSIIVQETRRSAGIILKLRNTLWDFQNLNDFIKTIQQNFFKKDITFIIDFPTRNIDLLEKYRNISADICKTEVFISDNLIFIEEKEDNFTLFYETESYDSNILGFFNSSELLKSMREDRNREKIKDSLVYWKKLIPFFENMKGKNEFSIKQLLKEFEDMFRKDESNNDWKGFWREVATLIFKYLPQHLEELSYYSGQSSNNYMRLQVLVKLIETNKELFLDYWVEGTKADPEKFHNIFSNRFNPLDKLIYPLFRYLNRNRDSATLTNIRKIVYEFLKGDQYSDQNLLNINLKDELTDIGSNILKERTNRNKLLKSGFDIFQYFDLTFIKELYFSNIIDKNTIEQFILSSKMTTKKIKFFSQNQLF